MAYVYNAVGSTDVGRRVQFDWLNDNFDEIYAYFGDQMASVVDNMLGGFMNAANTQTEIDELEAFLEEHLIEI